MSGVGGGSGGGGGGADGAGNDVAQELAEVKEEIRELKKAIKVQQEKLEAAEGNDARWGLIATALAADKQRLVELQKKENRLAEQQREQQAAQGGGDTKRRKLEPIRELAENDPVVRFWKALREVKEEVGDSGAEVVRLPDGVFWGGNKRLGSAVMVRQCYKDLFQLINDNDDRDRFVVTGTPGIGKSFFALYWLWRVANMEGGSAIYETGRFRCHLFCTDGNVSDALRDDAVSAGWFDDGAKRFYLVDLTEKAEPYHAFRGKTIVFCSPDPSRFKEFVKGASVKLFMPVWSDEEVEQLRVACYPEVDMTVAVMLRNKYGNIPRYVLQKAEEGESALLDAIAKRGGELKELFRVAGEGAGDDAKMSYKLLHLAVEPESDFRRSYLVWASPFVVDTLLAQHLEAVRAELKLLVAAGQAIGAYGSLRGHLFEGFAHRELAAGRLGMLRRLGDDASDTASAQLRQLLATNREQKAFSHLVGEELTLGMLLVPKARNLESLDSLLVMSGGDVVLFSVTVSQTHGAKVGGLLAAVRAAAQALKVAVRRKILLFVVPEDLVSEFGVQRYYAARGSEWKAAWPQELGGLEQWVVGIKVA